MRKKERKSCIATKDIIYTHTCVFNVFGDKLDDRPLTTHRFLNKRRIKGLAYRTRNSVILIGPGLQGFLGRDLCVGHFCLAFTAKLNTHNVDTPCM